MVKKVLVPLAPGFEEIEALAVVDILRRAGAEVTTAGTADGLIEGRSRIRVAPDAVLDDRVASEWFDMVVLPGGALGTENLRKNALLMEMIKKHHAAGRLVAAICSATMVLSDAGIMRHKRVTGHPTVWTELNAREVSDERVVTDGNVITSQSAGTALEFAFMLIEELYGAETVMEVNKSVQAQL